MKYETIRPMRGVVFARVIEAGKRVWQTPLVLPGTMHGRPNRAVVEHSHPDALVKPGNVVCFNPYKIRLVMSHGQLANAAGTPVANPGDSFAIDEENVLFIEAEEYRPKDYGNDE